MSQNFALTWLRATSCGFLLWAALHAAPAHAQAVTFLHTPPAEAAAGQPLHLSGNIFGAGELAKARVYFRRPGGRFSQVELRPSRGDEYEAVIPGREVRPPAIEYYVVAVDLLGRRSDIYASESAPQSVPVTGTAEVEEPPAPELRAEPPERRAPAPEVDAGAAESHVAENPPRRPAPVPEVAEAPDAGAAPHESNGLEEELALYGAEDVVSLATRHEQVVSDAPAIASSLSDEELKQIAARTVPDALKALPGFDTSRDVAGFWRISVRGVRADPEVLVLYDGHALNSPYDGRPLLAIPVDTLERVEVIRGPGSALYGTGAFLGVVNLVPKRRDEVSATLGAGWFNTFEGSFNAGHTWGGFGLHADGSVVSSDGYKAPITRDFNSVALEDQGLKTTDDPAGNTDDHRTFANVGAEAKVDVGGGTLALSGRVLHEDRGALVGLYDTVGPGSKLTWTVGLGDLTYRRNIGSGSISARLFFDQQSVDRFFQLTPANASFSANGGRAAQGLQEKTAFTTRTLGAELDGEIAVTATNRLDLGLSGSQLTLPSFSYLTNYQEVGTTVSILNGGALTAPGSPLLQSSADVANRAAVGVYAQDQWRPVAPLSLTLGIRADAIQLPTVTGSGATATVTGKKFVTSVNPRLGVVVNALPNLNFKLLYGRAFRAPTIQELADTSALTDYSGGRDSGSPNLRPATVDTVELGAEHVLATSEGKLRLRGNLFWNRFSDPILAVDSSGNDAPLQNRAAGIDVKGAELELRFEASARASAFANYSYFRAVDLGAVSPEFEKLTDVPQYRANIGLQLPVGPYLNFDLLAQLGAERRNNALSKLQALHHFRIPSYALVTAQLRTETLFNNLELALAAYNVLQQDYRDDVPRPDRIPDLLPGPGFSAELLARIRL